MRYIFLLAAFVFVVWCVATEDGKRVAVKITSALHITPPILEIDVEQLQEGMSESSVRALQSNLDYYCYEEKHAYGNHICNTNVSLFKGMPAYNIALFFKPSGLNAMRLALQPQSYDELMAYLNANFTKMDIDSMGSFTGSSKAPIYVYKTSQNNYLMVSRSETNVGEIILLWAASIGGYKPL